MENKNDKRIKGDKTMSELRIMDKSAGDLKVIWDKDNADEVEAARSQFDALLKKNFIAYTVDAKGEKGKAIRKFDANAEKIILISEIIGG